MGGVAFEFVEDVNCLGVNINAKFNNKVQVDNIVLRCIPIISTLTELRRRGFPVGVMIEIFHSMFTPILSYAIPIWGGLSDGGLIRLQVLQNRAIRSILGLNSSVSVRDKLTEFGILNVKNLYRYNLLLMGYKIKNNIYTQLFSTKLTPNLNFRTRKQLPYINQLTRFTITQRSFNYRLVEEWNYCEPVIRDSTSLGIFKAKIKRFLMLQNG
jgi:hypothetical protein